MARTATHARSSVLLKTARLNRGLSVAEVARLVGLTRQALWAVERRGNRPRNLAAAKRLADLFGFQVTDLWPLPENEAAPASENEAAA